jgi:nucleotide-binding universal stress UspA family protein
MTDNPGNAGRRRWILVGVDFSPASRTALAAARALAAESDRSLIVVHVIDEQGLTELARLAEVPEKVLHDRLGRARREQLAQLLGSGDADGGADSDRSRPETVIAWGRPFEVLVRKAADLPASLIVLGTQGHSADLEKALFGSTAEKVLRSAPCPVLCVPVE